MDRVPRTLYMPGNLEASWPNITLTRSNSIHVLLGFCGPTVFEAENEAPRGASRCLAPTPEESI